MTIAPCRALARFRHREKIAQKRLCGGRIYDVLRRQRHQKWLLLGQSWEMRLDSQETAIEHPDRNFCWQYGTGSSWAECV